MWSYMLQCRQIKFIGNVQKPVYISSLSRFTYNINKSSIIGSNSLWEIESLHNITINLYPFKWPMWSYMLQCRQIKFIGNVQKVVYISLLSWFTYNRNKSSIIRSNSLWEIESVHDITINLYPFKWPFCS